MEKENNDGDGDFYLFFDNMVMEEEEEDMIMMGKRGREGGRLHQTPFRRREDRT